MKNVKFSHKIDDEFSTIRREDSLLAELPAAASRSIRLAYSPNAVLYLHFYWKMATLLD